MTGRHALPIQWLVSGYDNLKHGFYAVDEQQGFLEALCGHSVPPERLLQKDCPECVACLLRHGSDLANEHGGAKWHD
jgi:hypothetical protein